MFHLNKVSPFKVQFKATCLCKIPQMNGLLDVVWSLLTFHDNLVNFLAKLCEWLTSVPRLTSLEHARQYSYHTGVKVNALKVFK